MLLRTCLDAERHDTAAQDDATRMQRLAAYSTAPYWPFAPRTAAQERIRHPLAAAERRRQPRASRFGDLETA